MVKEMFLRELCFGDLFPLQDLTTWLGLNQITENFENSIVIKIRKIKTSLYDTKAKVCIMIP